MNNRQVGAVREAEAAAYLSQNGYQILEKNFRCRTGEIDIIARDSEYLCFVEVKFRSGTDYGSPFEAVTYKKQQKIIRVAQYYMQKNGYAADTECRFDVVAVEKTKITLLKNAFGI